MAKDFSPIGKKYTNIHSGSLYEISGVTGMGSVVPSETVVVYLELAGKAPHSNTSQRYVAAVFSTFINDFKTLTPADVWPGSMRK